MKGLLASAGALAVVAGPVLFLFPYDTASYFAWSIAHPLTPVFMGASYLAGIGNLWAIRSNRWEVARVALLPIFVFGTGQLLATLLHLEIFNWSHPVAWAWLAVYVGSPPAALALYLAAQRRHWVDDASPAADEAGPAATVEQIRSALPGWIRPVMLFWSVVFGVLGAALFLAPDAMAGPWPWPLTPLTSRVIGGWYLASATLALGLSRQRSLATAWVGLSAALVVTPLLLLGSALHRDEFDGPPASTALWLLLVGGYGATSLAYWLSGRRMAEVGQAAAIAP